MGVKLPRGGDRTPRWRKEALAGRGAVEGVLGGAIRVKGLSNRYAHYAGIVILNILSQAPESINHGPDCSCD